MIPNFTSIIRSASARWLLGSLLLTNLVGQAQSSLCFSQAFYGVGRAPNSVVVADVNGDNRPDIITASVISDNVSVLFGQAGGGFGNRADYGVGSGPITVAVMDVNGDNRPDIITANVSSNNVSVLLGQDGGGFGSRADYGVGPNPYWLTMADVNGDNRPDIVTTNVSNSTVSVLLGQDGGSFGGRADYGVGLFPRSVVVADVNGDTRPDIITANQHSGSVSVLFGQAEGGFGNRTDYGVGSYPASVAVRDVNGDTRLDIITANYNSSSVSVLLGEAGGGFGSRTDYETGRYPLSVAVADINNDSRPDIITTSDDSKVNVLLGQTGGRFGTKTSYEVSYGPRSVVVADVNGDNRSDIVTANSDNATVLTQLATAPNVRLTSTGTLAYNNTRPSYTPSVVLTASSSTPGLSYNFSAGANQTQPGSNTAIVTTGGTYTVSAAGLTSSCRANASLAVYGANNPTVCRGGRGTLRLVVPGSPVRYEWYVGTATGQPLRDGAYYQGTTTATLTVVRVTQTLLYYAKVYYADGSSIVYGAYRVGMNPDPNCEGDDEEEEASAKPGNELRITLLGNPVEGDALRALVGGAVGQRLDVELVDAGGRLVRSQVFESADSAQLVEWSLAGRVSGVYVLQAVSGSQRQHVKVIRP